MIRKTERRRRYGDRSDGWLLRGQYPLERIIPYFMKRRSASSNMFSDSINIGEIEKYIRKKRGEGFPGFGIMHVLVAAYVRLIAEFPALNRFVSGQRVYARNNIEVMLNIKEEMTLDSPETVIKSEFDVLATSADVYTSLNTQINDYRQNPDNNVDGISSVFNRIPGLFLKFAVFFLKFLDYFGILPKALLKLSPFHGTVYLTSMGSLGIPPVFHHLYDFGNVPVFISFGTKMRKYEPDSTGNVKEIRYVQVCINSDERICDGYYFAAAFKRLKRILRDPSFLDSVPETVKIDPSLDKKKRVK